MLPNDVLPILLLLALRRLFSFSFTSCQPSLVFVKISIIRLLRGTVSNWTWTIECVGIFPILQYNNVKCSAISLISTISNYKKSKTIENIWSIVSTESMVRNQRTTQQFSGANKKKKTSRKTYWNNLRSFAQKRFFFF